MGPFRRSHHPHCVPFRPDVLVVAGRRLCVACFVGYPAIVLGLAAAWLAQAAWSWDAPLAWAAGGLTLALPQAVSFAGRVPTWRVQVLVKLCLGLGLGAFVFGVLTLPYALWARLAILVPSLMAVQALWVLRFHRLERTCQACPQLAMRPRCDGLRELDDRIGHLVAVPTAAGWTRVPDAGTQVPGGPAAAGVSSRKDLEPPLLGA